MTTTLKPSKESAQPGETIAEKAFFVAVDQIHVPADWNSRSTRWRDESLESLDQAENRSAGIEGLMADIAINGQETAVLLRPNKKGAKHPYILTAGFRRFEAIRRLSEKSKKMLYVKSVVRELSSIEARRANLRENTDRENLSAPDLAWGIYSLIQEHGAKAPTDVQIATDLGLTQSYTSKLHRIMRMVDPKITADWRDAVYQLTVNDMLKISELPKNEQRAAYNRLNRTDATPAANPEDATGAAAKALDNAKEKARDMGRLLANLVYRDLVEIQTGADWNQICQFGRKGKSAKLNAASIGKAASKAFEETMAELHEEETAEAGKDKRKQGGGDLAEVN